MSYHQIGNENILQLRQGQLISICLEEDFVPDYENGQGWHLLCCEVKCLQLALFQVKIPQLREADFAQVKCWPVAINIKIKIQYQLSKIWVQPPHGLKRGLCD